MRTVLITLIGPERTSDLVVDADTHHRGGIRHALESAQSSTAHTTSRVVHDIEPWHWHL